MKKYIFLFSILIISIIFSSINNNNKETCIILTTCVNVSKAAGKYIDNTGEKEFRIKQYVDTINKYLKTTNFPLYVVESSGYTFPEFKNNSRVYIYSFNMDATNHSFTNKTPLEAISILNIYNYYNLAKYKNIIKITGKYYIPNLESYLKNKDPNADIYVQSIHRKYNNKYTYQACEILGFKSKFITIFQVLSGLYDDKYLIECKVGNGNLYNPSRPIPSIECYVSRLINDLPKNKVYRFPKIKLEKSIRRGCNNCVGKVRNFL